MSTALDSLPEALSPETLDARFRKPLLSFFFRRTGDRCEAEDLTQQTFLRIYQISHGAPAKGADTFVFAVAGFLLKEHWRRRRGDGATSAARPGNLDAAADLPELRDDRSPEQVLLTRDSLAEALRLLAELGPRTHDIYVLFRLDRMKQKEIAARLGISVSAVEKHITRAAAHLARRLGRP